MIPKSTYPAFRHSFHHYAVLSLLLLAYPTPASPRSRSHSPRTPRLEANSLCLRKLVDVVKASSYGTQENKQSLADYTTHSHAAPKMPGVKKGLFGRSKVAPLPAQ